MIKGKLIQSLASKKLLTLKETKAIKPKTQLYNKTPISINAVVICVKVPLAT